MPHPSSGCQPSVHASPWVETPGAKICSLVSMWATYARSASHAADVASRRGVQPESGSCGRSAACLGRWVHSPRGHRTPPAARLAAVGGCGGPLVELLERLLDYAVLCAL